MTGCPECAALRARIAELERERKAYADGFRKISERIDRLQRESERLRV